MDNVPYDLSALYEFAEMFRYTTKPIVAWSFDYYDSNAIHRIAVEEAGGQDAFEKRPTYIHYCEPLSPLISTTDSLNKLVFAAEKRIPLIFTPCPLAGGTAPVTPAGIIIQAAAESWMGLDHRPEHSARKALHHGRRAFRDGYERHDPQLRRARAFSDDGWHH